MKWQSTNMEILAGGIAIVVALIFFWFQSATLGIYADPETGGKEFRSWVTWDCIDPFCVWNRMGATMHYISIAGSILVLIAVATIFTFAKYSKNRPNSAAKPLILL